MSKSELWFKEQTFSVRLPLILSSDILMFAVRPQELHQPASQDFQAEALRGERHRDRHHALRPVWRGCARARAALGREQAAARRQPRDRREGRPHRRRRQEQQGWRPRWPRYAGLELHAAPSVQERIQELLPGVGLSLRG